MLASSFLTKPNDFLITRYKVLHSKPAQDRVAMKPLLTAHLFVHKSRPPQLSRYFFCESNVIKYILAKPVHIILDLTRRNPCGQ